MSAVRSISAGFVVAFAASGCASVGIGGGRSLPALPDSTGNGVHVLAMRDAPNGAVWVGTYGAGIFVLPRDAQTWHSIAAGENDSTGISWNFVNGFAFPADGSIWYGTLGNGWGRSTDGGATWTNWTFSQLGPEWQYVAPDGLRARGDTVYIATADGLRITWDGGATWRCIQGRTSIPGGAASKGDGCTQHVRSLPTEYLLSLDVDGEGRIWVGHLFGASVSADLGETWEEVGGALPRERVRAISASSNGAWIATEHALYRTGSSGQLSAKARTLVQGARALLPRGEDDEPIVVAAADPRLPSAPPYRPAADEWAGVRVDGETWIGTATGFGAGPRPDLAAITTYPEDAKHLWFSRPIRDREGSPYIDQTYRYGSTMGGNFQQHQGVEFNNPAGTPVHAIGDGTVVFAGPAEGGANTVAILHDRRLDGQYVFTVYYHNSSLAVHRGDAVKSGDVISRVGNTGRATNDHLHVEVHVAPGADSSAIVNPDERFPRFTVNPQLWIAPMPGTGIVAGRVFDAQGKAIPGARVYGLVLPNPTETPFSFAETYRDRAHPDPAYQEHFAVGDVPAGTYMLFVEIDGARVWRKVVVEEGKVTQVEFRPE